MTNTRSETEPPQSTGSSPQTLQDTVSQPPLKCRARCPCRLLDVIMPPSSRQAIALDVVKIYERTMSRHLGLKPAKEIADLPNFIGKHDPRLREIAHQVRMARNRVIHGNPGQDATQGDVSVLLHNVEKALQHIGSKKSLNEVRKKRRALEHGTSSHGTSGDSNNSTHSRHGNRNSSRGRGRGNHNPRRYWNNHNQRTRPNQGASKRRRQPTPQRRNQHNRQHPGNRRAHSETGFAIGGIAALGIAVGALLDVAGMDAMVPLGTIGTWVVLGFGYWWQRIRQ